MTGHRDDNRCDDYEADRFVVEVAPDPDQCLRAGHGTIYVKFRADIWDSRMSLSANRDYLEATVNMTLEEGNTLREDLGNAIGVIHQKMTRAEFKQIVQDREATE